jgi:hypothetical protein
MSDRLLYSLSTGRCGTMFLANLFRANLPEATAVVHHERLGFLNFGVHTPDLSHMTTFNTVGNVAHIREFWQRKLAFDQTETAPVYIEMSHVLAKAGLLENLDLIDKSRAVDIVILTRPIEDIVWSYVNHFDFASYAFMWPFTLDPHYPNTILKLRAENLSPLRIAHWYVCEMWTRAAYYEQLLHSAAKVRFHRICLSEVTDESGADAFMGRLFPDERSTSFVMPPKANETRSPYFPTAVRDEVRRICGESSIDFGGIAAEFIRSGKRLEIPEYRSRPEAASALARYPDGRGRGAEQSNR